MFGQLSLVLIVASSALSAALAGGAAWTYQANRYEKEKAELYASAAAALRVQEQRYADQFRRATDQAQARVRASRVDADRARHVADGLRNDLARAVRAAETTPTACPSTAAALGELLADVEAEGRKLAETCDGHASDVRTLIEAWPR